jgi:hypothetical protein
MVLLALGSLRFVEGLVVGGVWGGWWFWIPPFALSPACVGGGGLVGLLFEICIVDASINKNYLS